MRKFTANWIYPIVSSPLQDHVIIIDRNDKIVAIDPIDQHDTSTITHVEGAIVPGFINAHCHLELSHMKGKAETGTGLIDFITKVVQHRGIEEQVILDHIDTQDRAMWAAGIQAVGDISNATHTAATKAKSPIRYHTFIEMFDFLNPAMTESSFKQYMTAYEAMILKEKDNISIVPHAPYTVSPDLFKAISAFNKDNDVSVSIHNQETPAENELFISKTGQLIDFYHQFDLSLEHFDSNGHRSIQYALPQMDVTKKTLLVHNTTCTQQDIDFAGRHHDKITWVSCPNANLYIENRLLDYSLFIKNNQKIAIGTDSLTSNWQLSILEEMKTIKKYNSFIDANLILQWATLNGAQALGFDHDLGSIEVGKSPGLIQVTADRKTGILFDELTIAKRII